MGNAVIVENVGAGLYKVRLLYQTAAIHAEIDRLEAESLNYWRLLNRALDTRIELRKDKYAAKETLDAIIKQWVDQVIDRTRPAPPVMPADADPNGNNPITGLPYTDEERNDALEKEVIKKVNASRVELGLDPVIASTSLIENQQTWNAQRAGTPGTFSADAPMSEYMSHLLRLKAIDDRGRNIHDRLLAGIPNAILTGSFGANAAGQMSSDDALAAWRRDPETWAGLMHPDATEIGASYRYNPQHPAAQMWSAVTAILAPVPSQNAGFFADPAGVDLLNHVASTVSPEAADALHQGKDGGSGGGGSGGGSWTAGWSANTEYGAGASVQGRRADGGGNVLAQALNYGVSGENQPLWPGAGGIAGDGTITWTVIAEIPQSKAGAVADYYAAIGMIF